MAEKEKEAAISNPEIAIEEAKPAKAEEKREEAAEKKARTIVLTGKVDKGGFVWGTGRRKSAVARVRLKPGQGKLLVNERQVNEYFTQEYDRHAVRAPVKVL